MEGRTLELRRPGYELVESFIRMRDAHLAVGDGGHGDHVLEISCSQEIPNVGPGIRVEIELLR